MRHYYFISFLLLMTTYSIVSAQAVYKSGTAIILDLSVEEGMPEGAVTTVPKVWTSYPSTTATMPNNKTDESLNATVYHKLEIAPSDLPDSPLQWVSAFNGCKYAKINGLGPNVWRLPTQRELLFMWIFKSAIQGLGADAFKTDKTYYSATEIGDTRACSVNFGTGALEFASKEFATYVYNVRCVREVGAR